MLCLNGAEISDIVVLVRRDISLHVDHLRQVVEVIADVLRFIGKHQARNGRQRFE